MWTSTLPFSIPQTRESGKRISTLAQTRNTEQGGDSARQDRRKLGEGKKNFLRWRICRAVGREGKWGNVPRASARHFASGHVGKVREEGERLPRARPQELRRLLLSEDLESWSFLLHFSPPGGHFSRFNRNKKGCTG